MKKVISFLLIGVLVFLCSSCVSEHDNGKPNVITTIFPLYDMVRTISDGHVNVDLMVSPGQDLHSYDPSTSDIINAKKADAVIFIGRTMETWIPSIVKSTNKEQVVVEMILDDRIQLETLNHHDDHEHYYGEAPHHDYDLHIWTNPRYAIAMADNIKDALVEIDEKNADTYIANTKAYKFELAKIIIETEQIVEKAKHKTLYFGCPFSFYYFTLEFGLDHYTIYDTCSIEVEPTIDKIVNMNTMLKENNVPVLYTKELLNDAIARKVIEGTNTEICVLHSAHNVSIEDFNKGITYLEIWHNNLEALRKGLL